MATFHGYVKLIVITAHDVAKGAGWYRSFEASKHCFPGLSSSRPLVFMTLLYCPVFTTELSFASVKRSKHSCIALNTGLIERY